MGLAVKIVRGDDGSFIPRADAAGAFRADALHVEDFEQLRGIALTGPDGQVSVRYVRERQAARRTSSRAERMAELAAAAREKHRGLFARLNTAPARDA